MAKTSMIVKAQREPKFSTRTQNRCQRCGRPHSVYRKFGLCRVCFRELASKGELPGVRKACEQGRASWRPQGQLVGRQGSGAQAHAPRVRANRALRFIITEGE